MRSGGRYSGRFATTVDYVAKKARIDRGDKADLIDNEGFEGRPTIRRALATLGTIEGYAVGGCCDLSTSTHHLVQRLGVEQGYNLAKESGRDLEEGIACATAGLRRRFAARVWRDYYKHVDARRRYANPTDEGLIAQQRDRQIEEESRRRENEERVAQYNYFAARASNRSAWARVLVTAVVPGPRLLGEVFFIHFWKAAPGACRPAWCPHAHYGRKGASPRAPNASARSPMALR